MSKAAKRSVSMWAVALLVSAAGHAVGAPIRQDVAKEASPPASEAPAPPGAEPAVRIDPALVKVGSDKYHLYCQRCHGLNMVNQGGGTFDLRSFPLQDKARFLDSVKNGKRSMPAWGGALGEQDLEALWHYIANHQVGKREAP